MAKKTEEQKRKDAAEAAKKAKDKKAKSLSSEQKSVKKDLEGGKRLNSELGFDAPLSRLDTNIPDDQRRFIEAQRALSDPSSPAYVGARSDEEKSGLSFLEKLMGDAGVRSEDMTSTLSKLKSGWETDGNRTTDTADVIARARNQADQAGQRSAEMQSTLDLMKGGLAGLNSAENTAIREQAQREVDRKRQAAIEAANSAARTGGLRGGAKQAALRGANRDAMMAQADMEQKNLISNIDIQDRRRTGYADTLSREEGNEFGRGNAALNTLGSAVGGAEERESQRMQSARDAYRSTLSLAEQNEFDQRATAGQAYNDRVGDLRAGEFDRSSTAMRDYGKSMDKRNDYFLDTSKTNLGQERTERAAAITGSTGLAGLVENERQRRKDARKSKGDGRDRASGDGRNSGTSTPAYDPMAVYNDYKSIYEKYGAI
jgi:hypothetical protein